MPEELENRLEQMKGRGMSSATVSEAAGSRGHAKQREGVKSGGKAMQQMRKTGTFVTMTTSYCAYDLDNEVIIRQH